MLHYQFPLKPPKMDRGGSAKFVRAVDNALPAPMLQLMQVCDVCISASLQYTQSSGNLGTYASAVIGTFGWRHTRTGHHYVSCC